MEEMPAVMAGVSYVAKFDILAASVEVAPFNLWLAPGPILGVLAVGGLAFYFLSRRRQRRW